MNASIVALANQNVQITLSMKVE